MTSNEEPVKCQGCGRKLTSAASIARGRGRWCQAKVRNAAAAAQAAVKPEQHARATELIEDGGIVRTSREGVYAASSSDGTTIYLPDANAATCTCKAGERGRPCYHLHAARILQSATARRAA